MLAPHQQTRGAGWKPLRWSASSKASRLTSGFAKGDELGAQRLWTRRTARPAPVFELDHAVVDRGRGRRRFLEGSLVAPWCFFGRHPVWLPGAAPSSSYPSVHCARDLRHLAISQLDESHTVLGQLIHPSGGSDGPRYRDTRRRPISRRAGIIRRAAIVWHATSPDPEPCLAP